MFRDKYATMSQLLLFYFCVRRKKGMEKLKGTEGGKKEGKKKEILKMRWRKQGGEVLRRQHKLQSNSGPLAYDLSVLAD